MACRDAPSPWLALCNRSTGLTPRGLRPIRVIRRSHIRLSLANVFGALVLMFAVNSAESVGATFINTATAAKADLAVAVTSSGIATVGGYMGYTIAVTNNGPATSDVALTDTTPSGLAFKPTTFYCVGSVPSPGSGSGWCGPLPPSVKCMKPAVGSAGTVSCTTASLISGASVTFIMAVRVGFYLHNQAICDTASATSTTTVDPNTSNNSATVCARVN